MDDYLADIFEELYREDGLAVIGRGLGMRRLLCKFLEKYCSDNFNAVRGNVPISSALNPVVIEKLQAVGSHHSIPTDSVIASTNIGVSASSSHGLTVNSATGSKLAKKIVFCINASGMEDIILSGLMTAGMMPNQLPKVITNEIPSQDRLDMYEHGGCFIVTSRILIVDMLDGKVDPASILGFLVPNAHRINETCIESFIIRLFREHNSTGFIKAFDEDPEQLHGSFGKTEKILKLLYIKKLYLWPRFQLKVSLTFQRAQPEVIEILQPLTAHMKSIQSAILVAMKTCIMELKKALPHLELGNIGTGLSLENGLFQHFDYVIRSQLDPEWHRISYRTKQLITDLSSLRKLVDYLLRYDAFSFYYFLLKLRQSSMEQQVPSAWMITEAANQIFIKARERVYRLVSRKKCAATKPVILTEEIMGMFELDQCLIPVLECSPKWRLLQEIVQEIRGNFLEQKASGTTSDCDAHILNNRVIIFVKDELTLAQLKDFLLHGDRYIMDQRYRWFISQQVADIRQRVSGSSNKSAGNKKAKYSRPSSYSHVRAAPPVVTAAASGSAANIASSSDVNLQQHGTSLQELKLFEKGIKLNMHFKDVQKQSGENKLLILEEQRLLSEPAVTSLLGQQEMSSTMTAASFLEIFHDIDQDDLDANDKEDDLDLSDRSIRDNMSSDRNELTSGKRRHATEKSNAGCLRHGNSKKSNNDDADETDQQFSWRVLDPDFNISIYTHAQAHAIFDVMEEISPKYVVLYDPDVALLRNIEVYQSSHPLHALKVYFLLYEGSAEQFRYTESLSREKRAFETLISTKENMVISLPDSFRDLDAARREDIELLTDSRAINQELRSIGASTSYYLPGKTNKSTNKSLGNLPVVVDVREFRCSLPSLLHGSRFTVIPRTISVGDYILTTDICVERKGISDLFQSFASGRLYNQVEAMAKHYKYPVLLIEFTVEKSFSLQSTSDITPEIQSSNIISKLSVLIQTFPTLRIFWSRSPFDTGSIFKSVMANHSPVDVQKAISVGSSSEGSSDDTNQDNVESLAEEARTSAQDMLLSLPGINRLNYREVMKRVENLKALSRMSEQELVPMLGPQNAKKLVSFFKQRVS